MHTSKILLALCAAVAVTCSAFAQTTDADQYRQQQAAARKDAQRARQAERAQAAKSADIDSDVAAESAAYLAEHARIQKHNNDVADYMTRDIAHRLAVWGQVGASGQTEFTAVGDVGLSGCGAIGIGYQLRRSKFLFTTGVEFMSINYLGFVPTQPGWMPGTKPINLGYIQLPLLFGMELPNWYWQIGAKGGYGVMSFVDGVSDKSKFDPLRLAPTAEIGMNFDKWSRPHLPAGQEMTPAQRRQFRMHYKLALFGEYGISNFKAIPPGYQDYSVGFKFTAAYQFRRQQKTMLPLPTRPRPAITFDVRDAQGRPVANAVVALHDRVSGSTFHTTTTANGQSHATAARGEYDIRAFYKGKKAEILRHQHVSLDGETVTLTLDQDDDTPPEVRIVDEEEVIIPNDAPCLVGRVCDAETGKPLTAVVRFGNWIDTTALYRGDANDRGVYVTRLHRGDYSVRVRKPGYMPVVDVIHFESDSILFKLKPIKVGTAAKVKDLFFVKDKATLQPESETSLAQLALFLRQNPDVCIRLTAHTDNQGDEDRLIRLSLARARMIRRNLVNRGIDINRIEIDGKGGTQPVADNESDYGRALNQRIVMDIISITGPKAAAEE